jgi:hypothetical protein
MKIAGSLNLKDFSGAKKKELWPLGGIFLILILTATVLIPQAKKIFSLREELTRQNNETQILVQKLADLQTLSEAELYDSANLLLAALPGDRDFATWLAGVKKTFEDNGVEVLSYNLDPGEIMTAGSKKGIQISPMSVTIAFKGTISGLRGLVSSLNRSMPIMIVDGISFEQIRTSTTSAEPRAEGKIAVRSYYKPLPELLGKIEKPLGKITNKEREIIETLQAFERIQAVSSGEAFSSESSIIVGRDDPFSP